MNYKEAIDLLGLESGATPEKIKQQYHELYNNFQSRITNAPTQKIKQKTAQNLEKLEQAYRFLTQSKKSEHLINYPSSNPVPKSNPTEDDLELIKPVSFTEEDYQSLKKWRGYLIMTSILFLAAATACLALYWQEKDKLKESEEKSEKDKIALNLALGSYRKGTKNFDFKIINGTNETIYIKGFRTFYYDSLTYEMKMLTGPDANDIPIEIVKGNYSIPKLGYDKQPVKASSYFIVYGTESGPDKISSGILNVREPDAQITANND